MRLQEIDDHLRFAKRTYRGRKEKAILRDALIDSHEMNAGDGEFGDWAEHVLPDVEDEIRALEAIVGPHATYDFIDEIMRELNSEWKNWR
jgi:hypothetical protein